MATTQKGIYYPDDYTAIADVPEDMKDLAESVDTALDTKVDKEEGKGLSTYNFGTVSKGRLDSLWNNKGNIESNIARIKATLPTTTGTGAEVTLQNTAELDFIQPPLPRGNSGQVQTTQSANLFDEDYYKNATYSTDVYKYTLAKFQGNRELYIKAKLKSGGSAISGAYVGISTTPNPNNSGGNYRMAISNGNVSAYAIKDFSGYSTLYFCYFPTNLSLSDIFDNYNIWVSTDDISYVPFVPNSPTPEYPSPIQNVTGDVEVLVQNKNLATEIVQGNIDTTTGQNIINPNAKYGITPNYVEINQTNIAVQYQLRNSTSYQIVLYKYDKDKNFLGFNAKSSNSNVFIVDSNVKYIRVRLETPEANVSSVYDVMIEQGTTATTYTPHQEQTLPLTLGNIELCKIGDNQDYFYKENSKWYLYKAIGKATLNGSEIVTADDKVASLLYYSFNIEINNLLPSSVCMCDKLLYSTSSLYSNDIQGIKPTSQGLLKIKIFDASLTTVSLFKTWLSTNNLTVYYVLATPTSTEITDTTLIEQLDAISNAISYDGQTNISGSSDESNPLFSVEAYQSIKLILAS